MWSGEDPLWDKCANDKVDDKVEEISKAKEKLRTEALKQEPAWLLVQVQLSGQAGIGQGWRRHGKSRKGFTQRGLLYPIQRSKAPKRQGPGRQDLRREFAFREAARIRRGVRQPVRRGSRPRGQRAEACGGGGVRRVTFQVSQESRQHRGPRPASRQPPSPAPESPPPSILFSDPRLQHHPPLLARLDFSSGVESRSSKTSERQYPQE